MIICKRCIVRGKVQGVFYRATAQQQALKSGVSGYAKNIFDGSVEVMACGEPNAVEMFCAWLWQGPELAEVNIVECESLISESANGFLTL